MVREHRISVIFFIFIFLFGNGIPIVLSLLRHFTTRSALERLPVLEHSCQLAARRPCRAQSTDSVVPVPVSFRSAVSFFFRPWGQAIDCRQAPEIILGLSMPPFTCPFVCMHFGAPALCVHNSPVFLRVCLLSLPLCLQEQGCPEACFPPLAEVFPLGFVSCWFTGFLPFTSTYLGLWCRSFAGSIW